MVEGELIRFEPPKWYRNSYVLAVDANGVVLEHKQKI